MSLVTYPQNPFPPSSENAGGTSYFLPVASAETLGGVKVGSNLSIDENGVLSTSEAGILTLKHKRYTGNNESSTVIDFGNETPAFIIGIRPDPEETYAGGDYNSIMPFGWNNTQTIAIWSISSGGLPSSGGGTNLVRISYSGNVVTLTSTNSRAGCNLTGQVYVVDYLA